MCSLPAPEAGAPAAMSAFITSGGLGVRVAGDMAVTAQGGVCVTYSDSTRTKDPQASYVGRTSGLAASRPMLLKRLLVYFSSTLYM